MQPNLLSGLLNNASTSMKVVQTNAKKKEELAKKELGTLSNVVKTTTAVAKANTPQVALGFGDKSNPQSLLELHKTTTGFQPLEFDNLMGTKQSGIPNLGFTDLGTKVVAPEKFSTPMDSITRDAQMVREDAVLRQNTTDDKVLKLMNQYTLSRDELFDLGAFKRKELEQQGEDTTGVDDVDLAEFALSETPEEEKAGFTRTGIIGSLQGAGIEGAEKQSQALAREQSGQQGVLSTKLQDVGSVAGYGADLIGDAFMGGLKKGGQLIDYITQGGASEVATAVGEKIKGTQFYNDVVAEGLNQLGQGIEQYNQRKQANPVEGANVDALLNIVDVGSQFIGGGVAKKAGQEALESGVARTIKEGVETGLQKGVKGLGNIGKTAGGIVEGFGNKVSGATDYAAKKLIDSKFKLTKTNKDAIRKSAGVEPSEFILENNIGGNNIDEMVENTKNMVDDAMQTKFQALSEVKELQPITQREKLIGQSIVKQAKGDIEEIYGKKFDEIGEDEIVPELKEQFTIVNNIEKVINEKEISPLKLEALKSLYDIYNSHLKYDLTKKRVLGAAEQIRLGLQSSIEGLGKTVGVDIKGLNKKIAGGKALEKGLIQAGDRLDNNNLFGLSDSQTAILSSALGGGGLEVAGVLGAKSLFENIGLRNKLARSLYTKKTPNVGSKITNNPSSVGTTAGSNITKQFGNTDTTMNGSKPIIQIKQKTPIDLGSNIDKLGNKITPKQGLSNLKSQGDMPEKIEGIPFPKTPKELPAKQKIADTPLSNLKNPKKSVQSDTLVSKSDEMEADRLANMQYAKEAAISNIQSIAKKNPEVIRKVLQKEGNIPDNKIESFIDDASNGKISERQATNVRDAIGKINNNVDGLSKYKESVNTYFAPEAKAKANSRIDYVVNGLRNSKTPAEMKDFISKIDLDYNYKNTFRGIALDRKLGFKEYFDKFNPHNFEQKMPDELYKKLKNIFIDKTNTIKPKNPLSNLGKTVSKSDSMSKDLQPLYDEAKKYKSAEEFLDGLKKKYSSKIEELTKKQKLNNPDDPVGYNTAKELFFNKNGITKSDLEVIDNNKYANIEGMEDTYIQYKKRGQDDFAEQQRKTIERAKISNGIFDKYDKVGEKRDNYYKNNEKDIMINANKWMTNDDANFVMMIKNDLPDISQLRKIREEANKKSPGLSNLKNK